MGPPAAPGTPGHAGWHELYTSNWENALSFYSELFGWEKADSVDMGSMGIYQLFGKDGTAFGGMMNKPGEMPNPAGTYYSNLAGLEAAAARVTEGEAEDLRAGERCVGRCDDGGRQVPAKKKRQATIE